MGKRVVDPPRRFTPPPLPQPPPTYVFKKDLPPGNVPIPNLSTPLLISERSYPGLIYFRFEQIHW